MNINVADRIQIIKDNVHIIKVENDNNETLWEYVEPTITGNDVLFAIDNNTSYDWGTEQPEVYHLTNDSTNKIFFYKYSSFDRTDSPISGYYTAFTGLDAWTDGTNTYINNYKYNTSTGVWTYQKWMVSPGQGYADDDLLITGSYIWTDGTDIFYLAPDSITGIYNSRGFKFNKSTNKWTKYGAIIPPSNTYYGNKIWTDGTTVYYSNGSAEQYYWDKTNQTWVNKQWYYTDVIGSQSFDIQGNNLFEINGTIYGRWVRSGVTKIFFLNSGGYWEPSSMSSSSYISSLVFSSKGKFTDGTNIYLAYSTSTTTLYKITETEPGTLAYESISLKSYPYQPAGLTTSRAFSLGMNAKKGDAKARLYSSTIF